MSKTQVTIEITFTTEAELTQDSEHMDELGFTTAEHVLRKARSFKFASPRIIQCGIRLDAVEALQRSAGTIAAPVKAPAKGGVVIPFPAPGARPKKGPPRG